MDKPSSVYVPEHHDWLWIGNRFLRIKQVRKPSTKRGTWIVQGYDGHDYEVQPRAVQPIIQWEALGCPNASKHRPKKRCPVCFMRG